MLMNQVLKDMRRAGHWEDEAEGGDSAGAQSLFEMLDAELASALTKAQGFGLTKQMLDAFDRAQGAPEPPPVAPNGRQPLAMVETGGNEDVSTVATVTHPLADVDASDITSAFGWRRDPMTGETRFHRGVDLASRLRTGRPGRGRGPGPFQRLAGIVRHDRADRARERNTKQIRASVGGARENGRNRRRRAARGESGRERPGDRPSCPFRSARSEWDAHRSGPHGEP